MREQRPTRQTSVPRRRAAAAWLTLAALLSLCLSQPPHASASLANTSSQASVVASGSPLAPVQAAHDADHCSLCRATAQARVGVRPSSCVGELASNEASLRLVLPTPELASSAPDLRSAPPRAPPRSPVLGA